MAYPVNCRRGIFLYMPICVHVRTAACVTVCLFVYLMDADVNECADGNNGDGCLYRCRNIDGGFFCQCPAAGPPTPSALCVGRSTARDDCFAMRGSVYSYL